MKQRDGLADDVARVMCAADLINPASVVGKEVRVLVDQFIENMVNAGILRLDERLYHDPH